MPLDVGETACPERSYHLSSSSITALRTTAILVASSTTKPKFSAASGAFADFR